RRDTSPRVQSGPRFGQSDHAVPVLVPLLEERRLRNLVGRDLAVAVLVELLEVLSEGQGGRALLCDRVQRKQHCADGKRRGEEIRFQRTSPTSFGRPAKMTRVNRRLGQFGDRSIASKRDWQSAAETGRRLSLTQSSAWHW